MDNMYNYTTTDQQIQKLKSQLLIFENENLAKQILQTYGYYNIINGYRDPYIIREYGTKKYSSDVTFEQIFALFSLDHEIRDAVLLSMIDLEEHLRATVADIIAEDFGSDYKQYLQKNNYRDKAVTNLEYRNLAAHGGRIYNYIPSCNIRYLEESNLKKGLPQFVATLKLFQYAQPYARISEALSRALNTYCPCYPNDLERLERAIGFEITQQQYIWVNTKTKKMHCDPHCSGSSNCLKIPYQKARAENYTPCKKCFH